MYNSSIKGQSTLKKSDDLYEIENQVFINDMSKNYMHEAFKTCDVIFSEISWQYGYKIFNERAKNAPNEYSEYMNNINKLINELKAPAFIVCGKPASKYFKDAKQYPIKINTSNTNMNGCTLYVWNHYYTEPFEDTESLTDYLSKRYSKCLDFSCGYGEHLLKFDDFVGCDINADCISYLAKLKEKKDRRKKYNGGG